MKKDSINDENLYNPKLEKKYLYLPSISRKKKDYLSEFFAKKSAEKVT